MESLFIAGSNVTLKAFSAVKVGKTILLAGSITYSGSSLSSLNAFSINEAIVPAETTTLQASNATSGNGYAFIADRSTKTLRFPSLSANNTYTSGTEIYFNGWYQTD